MRLTDKVGIFAVPVIIILVLVTGAFKRVELFGSFTEGAREGLRSLADIAPSLLGLVVAVSMLEASGFFELLTGWLAPVCGFIGLPPEVLPLGLMRPVTGSGSFAMLDSLLEKFGADSVIGKTASVMAGSTETTFYAITVYYGAVGLKKTRHTIPAAVTADIMGMLMAGFFVKIL